MILSEPVIKAAMGRAHAMGFALNEQMTVAILTAAIEAAGESVAFGDEHGQEQWVGAKINQLAQNLQAVMRVVNQHGEEINAIKNFFEEQQEALDTTAYHHRPEEV